jgi:hypothetical protein
MEAEEHTPAPAQSGAVRGLAEAIAEQIAAQQAGDNTISGSFDAVIVYSGIEYTLTVKAPNPADAVPRWIVTGTRTDLEKKKTVPFLTFEFIDQNNWTAGAGLPMPITFSNGFEIKHLYGEFTMSGGGSDAPDAED